MLTSANVELEVGVRRGHPERLDGHACLARQFECLLEAEPHDLLECGCTLLLHEPGEVIRGARGQVTRVLELSRSTDQRRRRIQPAQCGVHVLSRPQSPIEVLRVRRLVHSPLERHLQPPNRPFPGWCHPRAAQPRRPAPGVTGAGSMSSRSCGRGATIATWNACCWSWPWRRWPWPWRC